MPRNRSLVAVVGSLAVAASGLTGTAGAAGASACNPTPQVDGSFCVAYALSVNHAGSGTPESNAAAPVDLTVAISNTSTHHADDGTSTVWLKQVALELLSGLGGHAYTPSAQLPDGLVVAGSSSSCGAPPDFSACTAGNGTFYAKVSGSGIVDGVHPGTFGIQSITNVGAPPTGTILDWQVTADFCISTSLGSCWPSAQEAQFNVTAAAPSSTSTGDSITMPLNTTFSPATGVTVDASLDQLNLNLNGTSTQVYGQPDPLATPKTILHLPTQCGTASGTATFTDRADTSVTFPLSQPVVGCPTARFAKAEHLLRLNLDGSTSTTPIAGRVIKRWHWTFGDGTSRVTTGPKVAHTYSSSRNRTMRLVVEDSLGALSTAHSWLLRGSAMTWSASASKVAPGTAVTLSGRLTRWHSTIGLGGRSVRIQRCKVGTNKCTLVKTVTTSRHSGRVGRFSLVIHPTAAGDYRATFFGGGGYLGVRKSRRITMS